MTITSKVTSSFVESDLSDADVAEHHIHKELKFVNVNTIYGNREENIIYNSKDIDQARTSSHSCGSNRLTFRDYQMFPTARLLLRNGQNVDLGSRAFDLLYILLWCRGKLVSKATILQFVWPETYVDESNLRFQMGCLRKALEGDRNLIITIPGRGYLFAEELPKK